MNNTEYNIKCFRKEKSNYELKHKEYIDRCNEEKEKNGCNTVILTTEELELINSLRLAILYWVSLFEKIKVQNQEDIKFISGIRYVNNIFKHSKKSFETSEISRAGIEVEVEIDEIDKIEIENVEINPTLVWGDMDLIPIDDNLSEREKRIVERQKKNYKIKLKEKKTLDSLENMEKLLVKYYTLSMMD